MSYSLELISINSVPDRAAHAGGMQWLLHYWPVPWLLYGALSVRLLVGLSAALVFLARFRRAA